jgi:hypothetical protein
LLRVTANFELFASACSFRHASGKAGPAPPEEEREEKIMEKLTGLAAALGVLLAVVAGVVPNLGFEVGMVLVILGIIAGITVPGDMAVRVYVAVLAFPVVGSALGTIPAVGDYLNAIFNNFAMAAAGIAATLMAIRVYTMAKDGLMGLAGGSN